MDKTAVDDARIVDVEWKTEGDSTSPVKLFLLTVDKPGMIASLSALISSLDVNIRNLKANVTEDKKAHITFILDVTNKKQLSALIQKITQLEGVIKVMR